MGSRQISPEPLRRTKENDVKKKWGQSQVSTGTEEESAPAGTHSRSAEGIGQ